MKMTVPKIKAQKGKKPITMLTAYSYTVAKVLDEAGIEVLLVGDSLGMVFQGKENTLEVSLEEIIYHCQCVHRGRKRAHLVGDLPFMSYQVSVEEALRNAGRLLKEGAVDGVKLEGGEEMAETVFKLTERGIPVMGHVGLQPQRVKMMGGYKIQGKGGKAARQVLKDASAIAQAGAYSLVLEGIPASLAKEITQSIDIPTVGIGSGPDCDGQVLVIDDLLGLNTDFIPKFVKTYANLAEVIKKAVGTYCEEVEKRKFPAKEHSF
ncbi:MAG: 3-methyl-2-oxobutanoate hydroxymethyltransferase [Deltaproteobacteria bacterium]|nr:3-methyl-2-oxobutanoate hydroxymethyltransferase [Deltaproteobacteria bacterium]